LSLLYSAVVDIKKSLNSWRLWSLLGWLEVRQRYSRSKLGPLWLTISMGVMVGTLGVVYGSLFGQELGDYLPMLAISIVVWNLFSGIVTEGSQAYIASAHYIRQINTPYMIYILQVLWRNFIIFCHNAIIVIIVMAVFGVKSWQNVPIAFIGLGFVMFNALWIAVIVAIISARYRDLPQIISALLQVAFYVTPILFSGEMLRAKHAWIVDFNPMSYLIDAARLPLMGTVPSSTTWYVCVGMAIVGWSIALFFLGKYRTRIPYWV